MEYVCLQNVHWYLLPGIRDAANVFCKDVSEIRISYVWHYKSIFFHKIKRPRRTSILTSCGGNSCRVIRFVDEWPVIKDRRIILRGPDRQLCHRSDQSQIHNHNQTGQPGSGQQNRPCRYYCSRTVRPCPILLYRHRQLQ